MALAQRILAQVPLIGQFSKRRPLRGKKRSEGNSAEVLTKQEADLLNVATTRRA